eukprot:1794228-Amphidinium_carterae.1
MVPENGCHNIDFHAIFGRTDLVIQFGSTISLSFPSSTVFLDQSIVLWFNSAMPSQWHFNYLSGSALAHSSHAGAFHKWLLSNGFNAIVKEFFVNESEPRTPQSAVIESEGNASFAIKLMAPRSVNEEEFTVTVNNKRAKTTVTIEHW